MSTGDFSENGEAGDWIHIKFKDAEYVGRFYGIYHNPSFGLMYRISYARRVDDPTKHTTLYVPVRHGNGNKEALDRAAVIEKPKLIKGKLHYRAKMPDGASLQ